MSAHTALEMPALNGEVVTEAHANICAERGHATHTVNGADTEVCPRCGEVKAESDNSVAKFETLLDLESQVRMSKASEAFSPSIDGRWNAKLAREAAQAKLFAAVDTLTSAEAEAYALYRR